MKLSELIRDAMEQVEAPKALIEEVRATIANGEDPEVEVSMDVGDLFGNELGDLGELRFFSPVWHINGRAKGADMVLLCIEPEPNFKFKGEFVAPKRERKRRRSSS